jgi:GR25 family glycosyltransferase involved in LPS biosynthesis
MAKYLLVIFFVWVVHITSVDSSSVCIVLGEHTQCHVDVANPNNVTNFTIAAAKKCQIGHNDITNNEIEFEVTKDHMLAWLNIRKFRRKEFKKYVEIQNSKTDGKIKLEITGRCGNEIHQQASNSGGYISIGSNLLNIFSEEDWKCQIGLESTIDQIIIPEYVWAKLLLIDHAENNGRKKMMILINNMFKYIKKENGIILFSTPSYKENDRLKMLLQFLNMNYSHIDTSYILLMPHEGDSKTEIALPYVFNAINALVSIFPPLLSTNNKPKNQHELCTNSKFCVEKTYVVNLNRRIHRYHKFKDYALKDFGFIENIDYFRFNAIDGSTLNMASPTIQSLFRIDKESLKNMRNPYRDHGFRPGVIGCSLSNIAIWFELAKRHDLSMNDAFLILEDDVWFSDNFINRWKIIYQNIIYDNKWDFFYLGYSTDYDIYQDNYVYDNVKQFSRHERSIGGGTFGYVMRKKGAIKLLDKIKSDGIQSAIDWFMIQQAENDQNFTVYKAAPLLIHTTPVLHTSSDTTTMYPEAIIKKRAVDIVSIKREQSCATDKKYDNFLTESKGKILYDNISTTIDHLPRMLEPTFNVEPSIIVNLEDKTDVEQHLKYAEALRCANLCVEYYKNGTLETNNEKNNLNKHKRKCKPVSSDSKLNINDVEMKNENEVLNIQSFLEINGNIIDTSRSSMVTSELRPSIKINVVKSHAQGLEDSFLHNVDVRDPTSKFQFIFEVVDREKSNPSMWRICFKISSIWFPTKDLGCQPITSEIVLSNLHYGYQTLIVTLKDFIEHTILYETNHTFLVSAVTTNITKSSDWNEKEKMCIRDTNSSLVYDGFYDRQAVEFSSSISLAVLAYRKKESLIQSLITWNENGLLHMMSERLIFFQNCPTCKFGKLIDTTQNNNQYTKQVIDLLEKFNFKIIGSDSNVGLAKAMASLVQTASSKNVLFLEEDWQLESRISNNELHIAQQMLDDKFVHAVKFRSSNNPGKPYCSEVWKGYEHLMLEDSKRGGDGKLSIMNAASWQSDDYKIKQLFGNRIWRCHSKFLCANSYVCGWTNNPTLYSKKWFIENLLEVAKNAHHFESAVNLSPNVWDAKCWVIAQGKGLFTHVDLEKKISEQSPCEIPEIILQQQLN